MTTYAWIVLFIGCPITFISRKVKGDWIYLIGLIETLIYIPFCGRILGWW